MALKLPDHGFLNLVKGKALKKARTVGEIRKDKFDEMSYLLTPKKKLNQKKLVQEAEDVTRAIEQKTRLAQGAVAVPVAVGAGVGANEIYKTEKKDKKILKNKAEQIYRAGESNVVKGMLHDPRFPLGAKLRILEGEGVIKTSSLWGAIKGTNYKAAKGQADELGKKLTDLSKKVDEAKGSAKAGLEKKQTKAEKAWTEAQNKVWKEGFKTWSSRIGLGTGAAVATPVVANKIKEAAYMAPTVVGSAIGAGAIAGGATAAINPKLPDNGVTRKEILEGTLLGAGTGAVVGGISLLGPKIIKSLRKKAALDVSDIEKSLGENYNLSEEKEKFVRKSLGQRRSDSFILQHPYLTGIPTLGIAPGIKQHLTKDKIIRQLAKRSIEDEGDVYRLYIN